MEKSAIEKIIERRAIDRFDKELTDLIKLLSNNIIANKLIVNVDGCKNVKLVSHNYDTAIITQTQCTLPTNFIEIKKNLIERFIKEETDDILSKLENLKYLFENIN